MAEKTIKHRLFTWFENVKNPADPEGGMIRLERIAWLGQTIDITDDLSLQRGEELDAFFTEEEAEAIANGTFTGPTADAVYRSRTGTRPSQVSEGDDVVPSSSIDVKSATSEEIGDYIRENHLNVTKTKELVPDDADTELIEKIYDAETFATENDPRKGVTDYLDAKLQAAAE